MIIAGHDIQLLTKPYKNQNELFRHFLKFGSYVFPETAHDDSSQKCLTSSRTKTSEKNIREQNLGQTGQNRARN